MNEDLELSEREIDIIRLVATGASNKEIAQILVISPNTVKVHLRNIFTKLNVVSRTEATMAAISRGWVESPKNLNASAFIEEEPDNFSGLIAESDLKNKRSPWLYVLASAAALLILATAFLLWNNAQINQRAAQVNTIAATTSAARRWEMLTPLATGLKNMAALRYERSFYLFGGINSSGTNPDVLIFNIDENSWSLGAKKPKPVSHIQAAALGENGCAALLAGLAVAPGQPALDQPAQPARRGLASPTVACLGISSSTSFGEVSATRSTSSLVCCRVSSSGRNVRITSDRCVEMAVVGSTTV